MSLLRVLLSGPPDPRRADPWALFDDAGRATRRGRDVPAAWPPADRREAVLAAGLTRLVAVALPPMSAERVPAALGFALEDQLAADGEAPVVVAGPRRADGTLLATIVARPTLAGIVAALPRFDRIVAEAALAPADAGWTWCDSAAGGGFLRRADGSAFAIGAASGAAEARTVRSANDPAAPPGSAPMLPAELAAAIRQARQGGELPGEIGVARDVPAATLAAWSLERAVRFVARPAWRWDDAPAAAFAAASDLSPGSTTRARAATGDGLAAALRPALIVAAAALALHVGATFAAWAVLVVQGWRTDRAIVALARDAGLPEATDREQAVAALRRRHAGLRHRAGLATGDDALPLLAQAAPALARLPAGAIKSATYNGDAWTLELANVAEPAQAALDRALTDAGLVAVHAQAAGATRLRLTAAP